MISLIRCDSTRSRKEPSSASRSSLQQDLLLVSRAIISSRSRKRGRISTSWTWGIKWRLLRAERQMWTRFVSVCIFHGDPYPKFLVKEREAEVNKSDVLFGMTLGATAEDEDIQEHGFGTRSVRAGRRVRTTIVFPFVFLTFVCFHTGFLHSRRSGISAHTRPRTRH